MGEHSSRVPVSRIMRKPVVTIAPDESVTKAARLMRDNKIGALVVVENYRPVGMISDRDIVEKVVAEKQRPGAVKVRDAMGAPLVHVSSDTPAETAAEIMGVFGIRRLPVMDENRLVGIITEHDMVKALPEMVTITRVPYAASQVFMVHRDGRLITHSQVKGAAGVDREVFAGMLTALQSFFRETIGDAHGHGGKAGRDFPSLDEFLCGGKKVLVSRGSIVNLMLVMTGDPPEELRELMGNVVKSVEWDYGKNLLKWNGERDDTVKEIEKTISTLLV